MTTVIAKSFLSAKDISLYMGVSLSMAYRIIRQLNEELSESGYITVAGKVSRSYFEEKTYMNKGRDYVRL
jgi:ribosomal protein S25